MQKLLSLFIIFIFSAGCSRICQDTKGADAAGLTITFFNTQNNRYFYPTDTLAYPSPFKIDSLKVRDSNGRILRTPYQTNNDVVLGRGFYVVGIYPIFIAEDDAMAFEKEVSKTIFLQYNHNTFDTIKLVYKAKKSKCADFYEYLKAYRRNQLISETYNSYSDGLLFTLNY
ncbi:MAG: hypothetical protein HEQ40_09140 [Lacibacter sp.]|jgi:hypothetical protein